MSASADEFTDVVKGLAVGLAGGAAASWAMEEFQAAWSRLSQRGDSSSSSSSEGEGRKGEGREEKSATVRTAEAISHAVLHRDLAGREEQAAGRVVHYVYGTMIGGLYGAVAEVAPVVTVGVGTAYGAAVWLIGDEAVVPLLGLSKAPTEFPPSTHLYALASHLVYGLTLDGVRRAARAMLD
jgi:putative membrane protein